MLRHDRVRRYKLKTATSVAVFYCLNPLIRLYSGHYIYKISAINDKKYLPTPKFNRPNG
jgi:hypothetical protein